MHDVPSDESLPGRPPTTYLVKQLEIAVRYRLDQVLARHGITAVQYTLLAELDVRPDATGADLARRWHLRPQSTSEVIVGLEKAGLVQRSPNPAHRKRLLISLTTRGTQMLSRIQTDVSVLDEAMHRALPSGDHAAFRDMLRHARRALERFDG